MKELNSILKSIKNKTLLPIYFFHGQEPYYIDKAVHSFENDILSEEEKVFGQTIVYGKDTTYGEILASAQQMPMFGELNIIIVKEAQDLKMSEDEQLAFERYIENPIPTTLLVFAHKHKKIDSRKKFAKLLKKNNQLFLSDPIKDYQLANWISDECKALGIQIAPNISHLLAEYLGNDLSRIENELNKIKLILKEGEILDGSIVEKHIGISKEYNVFELQNALGAKDEARVFKIVHFMGKNPKTNPIVMTIGTLFNFFSKVIIYNTMPEANPTELASALGVNPYFLKDYAQAGRLYPLKHATKVISLLREIDLKSKGLGANQTSDDELLKELAYKILNIHQIKVST